MAKDQLRRATLPVAVSPITSEVIPALWRLKNIDTQRETRVRTSSKGLITDNVKDKC